MNSKTIFIKTISVILAAAMSVLLLTSCSKTPSNTASFNKLAQKYGLKVYDVTIQYANAPQIINATVAVTKDRSFQIEFYIITDRETAKKLYMAQSDEIENYKVEGATGKVDNGSNYAKRTAVSNGNYLLVAYIENTVLYVPPTNEEANRETIDKFIKEFKY